MKPKLLLLSHGGLAVEIHKVLNLFTGENENVTSLRLDEELGVEGLKKDIQDYFEKNKDVEVIALADIYGGSPFNIMVGFLTKNTNLRLLTGLNLPMLLEYSFSKYQVLDEIVKGMVKAGTEAVKVVSSKDFENDDDDDIEID